MRVSLHMISLIRRLLWEKKEFCRTIFGCAAFREPFKVLHSSWKTINGSICQLWTTKGSALIMLNHKKLFVGRYWTQWVLSINVEPWKVIYSIIGNQNGSVQGRDVTLFLFLFLIKNKDKEIKTVFLVMRKWKKTWYNNKIYWSQYSLIINKTSIGNIDEKRRRYTEILFSYLYYCNFLWLTWRE